MILISNIVDSLDSHFTLWRTLKGVEIVRHQGRLIYSAGNVSVVFQVWHEGVKKSLKCYIRSSKNLPHIYKSDFYAKELCVFDIAGRRTWVDCLLTPYIEGITLDEAICKAERGEEFEALAEEFDRMAGWLLEKPFAHGDLKPENIIVMGNGKMRAIDWDAAFLPELSQNPATERGTAAYQHPLRGSEMYDKHIDDYSIAMLSTMLHLYAIKPEMSSHFKSFHEPKLLPKAIIGHTTEEFESILDLFARQGMAREYQIAKMLRSSHAQLFDLRRMMGIKCIEESASATELDEEGGLWGYRNDIGWVIAPIYDMGFEPMDGVALVRLGEYYHFIGLDGRILKSFPASVKIKPQSQGRALIRTSEGEEQIINLKELVKSE